MHIKLFIFLIIMVALIHAILIKTATDNFVNRGGVSLREEIVENKDLKIGNDTGADDIEEEDMVSALNSFLEDDNYFNEPISNLNTLEQINPNIATGPTKSDMMTYNNKTNISLDNSNAFKKKMLDYDIKSETLYGAHETLLSENDKENIMYGGKEDGLTGFSNSENYASF